MDKTGPSTAALVSTLEPVVTVISSIVFLKEKMTVNIIIGGALVITSLISTVIPSRK